MRPDAQHASNHEKGAHFGPLLAPRVSVLWEVQPRDFAIVIIPMQPSAELQKLSFTTRGATI
jgi:hypothetical protein